MITPTVGRVVWYWPQGYIFGSQPCAAQVAYVHNDTLINIGYWDHNGLALRATSVYLLQEGNERPTGPHAEWMPYQKGQAAKTEAAEKELSERVGMGAHSFDSPPRAG